MPTYDLRTNELVQKIESKIVGFIEDVAPVLDRSYAEVQKLEVNTDTGIANVKVKVVARNSPAAFIPVSATAMVEFEYNMKTGQTSKEVVTFATKVPGTSGAVSGPEVSVNIGTLRAICDGDFSKALELIPNGGVVEREINSDYDRIKESYVAKHGGSQNVYFASAHFVRWAGLGTAGKWVAEALASGGLATTAIMQEIKTEALKELTAIVAWLENRGKQNANQIIQQLLNGDQIDWPFMKIVFQTIRYASRLKVGGRVVGPEFGVNRHLAFVIVWTSTGGTTETVEPISDDDPLDTDAPNTPPIRIGPFNRTAKIAVNGLIHDDDSGDPFGGDEEESYLWSKDVPLEGGGPPYTYNNQRTVDGEVRLKLKLTTRCKPNGTVEASGVLELWEGPFFTLNATAAIPQVTIPMNKTKTLYDNQLADNEGNFADVKLTLTNDVATV